MELLALQNQRFFWMMKELTPELLKGCRNDDRRSQSLLYEMISGVLYGMTRRYYINKEDRIMQVNTAYMKILTSLKKQTPEGSFEAWCRSIMRNCIIDEFRCNWAIKTTRSLSCQSTHHRTRLSKSSIQVWKTTSSEISRFCLHVAYSSRKSEHPSVKDDIWTFRVKQPHKEISQYLPRTGNRL